MVEVPLYDQRPVAIDMNVTRSMVSNPGDEDITTAANPRHPSMLRLAWSLSIDVGDQATKCSARSAKTVAGYQSTFSLLTKRVTGRRRGSPSR